MERSMFKEWHIYMQQLKILLIYLFQMIMKLITNWKKVNGNNCLNLSINFKIQPFKMYLTSSSKLSICTHLVSLPFPTKIINQTIITQLPPPKPTTNGSDSIITNKTNYSFKTILSLHPMAPPDLWLSMTLFCTRTSFQEKFSTEISHVTQST